MQKGIKQSDFMKTHGLTPFTIKAYREANLKEGEWWKDGVTIMWSEDAVKRLEGVREYPPQQEEVTLQDTPKEDPEFLMARSIKKCPNKRMLYAALPDGTQVAVNCGRHRDNLLRKTIRVNLNKGESVYTYCP